MCALSDGSAKSSVVLDRELDQKKSLDPSGPRIRCPLCGWSPRKDDRCPAPAAMDFDTVSFLYPVVAAFRLVYAAMKHSKQQYESRRYDN